MVEQDSVGPGGRVAHHAPCVATWISAARRMPRWPRNRGEQVAL